MLFIMRQTCQTIFSLTIFRLLPTPGSGLLFVLLLFGCSNLSLLSLELLWNPGNAVAPERLLWCVVSVCVHVCVSTKKHESVAFNIRLIWSLASQRFLHDTPQWSHTHTQAHTHYTQTHYTSNIHSSKYIISCSSTNKIVFCPRLHMRVGKQTYGFPCIRLTVWRMFWICGPRLC